MHQKKSSGFTTVIIVILILLFGVITSATIVLIKRKNASKSTASNSTIQPSPQPTTPQPSPSTTTGSQSATDMKNQTMEKVFAIRSHIEAYYADNGWYPGDLSPAPLVQEYRSENTTSSASDLQKFEANFTPPTGVKYTYTATPAGCTTAAKNCQHYTISATQISTGKILYSASSL